MSKPWVIFAIGDWVLVSPWLLGFADISIMKWSNLAAGTILILMALWDIFGERAHAMSIQEKSK